MIVGFGAVAPQVPKPAELRCSLTAFKTTSIMMTDRTSFAETKVALPVRRLRALIDLAYLLGFTIMPLTTCYKLYFRVGARVLSMIRMFQHEQYQTGYAASQRANGCASA